MSPSRLAALLCWGAVSLTSQAPPAAAPRPPAQAKPASVAPKEPGPKSDTEKVARLRQLVEEGEKALDGEDEDTAYDRAEEAEVLVADWSDELLERPDVLILLERLKGVQDQVPDEGEEMAEEPGAKAAEEVVTLKGSELESELERVKAAEAAGAAYDFPIDLNDKVLTWVRLFTTEKRGYMERTLSRGSAYLPMIRQVFAEEGIPQDLAYLGVVESGYLNQAKSYAKAVGMWQFMRSTGRLFGLGATRWVEERRDPVKATRAAARYLRRLYELSGDWYLALVGYNAGPLTTEKAVRNLDSRNFWDMYRSPYLRNQTKNYIPELCAAILVGHNPEKYGLHIEQQVPFVYETVQVNAMTSLKVLARCAGTDIGTLKELNPELIRDSTPPGAYPLRVPPGKALAAQRQLAQLSPGQRTESGSYKLLRGDTLARVAKRFGVSQEDLLEANHIKAAAFRPGRRIVIPPPAPALGEMSADAAQGPGASLEGEPLQELPAIPGAAAPAQTPVRTGSVPAAAAEASPDPAPAPEAPAEAASSYRAKPGDTLAKIARAKGLSLGELIRLNPRAAEKLSVGDAVLLPGAASDAAPKPAVHASFHVVQRGETLSSIAARYGVSVAELKRWNRMKSGRVRRGQRLRVAPA